MDLDDRVKVYDKWDVLTIELHGRRRQSGGYDKWDVRTIELHELVLRMLHRRVWVRKYSLVRHLVFDNANLCNPSNQGETV